MHWIGIFNLLATAQSFLFGIIFLTREKNRVNNLLLALISIAFGFAVMGSVLAALGYYKMVPHLIRVGDPVVLAIPPLLYLYTKQLCHQRLSKIDLFHFIPFFIYLLVLLPFYAKPAAAKIAFIEQVFDAEKLAPPLVVIAVLRLLIHTTYIFLSLQLVKQHDTLLKNTYSTLSHIGLDIWQKILSAMGILVLFLILLFVLTVTNSVSFLQANIYNGFVVSLMLYGAVYYGWARMNKKEIAEIPVETASGNEPIVEVAPVLTEETTVRAQEHGLPTATVKIKYQTSGLTEEDVQRTAAKLEAFMAAEKPFTDPELNLNTLAKAVNLAPHQLSQVINQQFRLNFFDFINSYRVKEVIRLMQEPKNAQYTLISMAFEAGFNSKTTFNSAFKKQTGKTPSQFKLAENQ